MIRLTASKSGREERESVEATTLCQTEADRQRSGTESERAHAALDGGSREGGSVPSIFPPAVPGHREEEGEEMDWAAGGRG